MNDFTNDKLLYNHLAPLVLVIFKRKTIVHEVEKIRPIDFFVWILNT